MIKKQTQLILEIPLLHSKKSRYFISLFLSLLCMLFSISTHASEPSAQNPAESLQNTTGMGISANPAAVNIFTGTGDLQHYLEKQLGITHDHGIRIGGLLIGDINNLFSGGISEPERWTSNALFIFDLSLDAQKAFGWKGALFDVQFLQFNGQDTNTQAGALPGYNSLPAGAPFNRTELYQLWYRQTLFDDKFIFRIGKMAPTFNFNNVSKPVPLSNENLIIPAVTSLIYTPIFVNPSILGLLPGYYNSAYGITLTLAPSKQYYFSYGAFDDAIAQNKQTGTMAGPVFDGSYFHIGEAGISWLIGQQHKPGNIGIGAWHEAGPIKLDPNITENGASGVYVFGTQRVWYKNPSRDISGVSAFYQYGINNSDTLSIKQFLGAGATAFSLIPTRSNDSFGAGVALSWMNPNLFTRSTELMYQAYYQAQMINSIYLQPTLSYIPTPGISSTLDPAWAGSLRLIVLF